MYSASLSQPVQQIISPNECTSPKDTSAIVRSVVLRVACERSWPKAWSAWPSACDAAAAVSAIAPWRRFSTSARCASFSDGAAGSPSLGSPLSGTPLSGDPSLGDPSPDDPPAFAMAAWAFV